MDEFQEAFIKKTWIWGDPQTVKIAAQLSAHGINLEDLRGFLGLSEEEMKQQLLTYPEIKMAYDTGPGYMEYKLKSRIYETAINGNLEAAKTILAMNKSQKTDDQFELDDILNEIEVAEDTIEMSLVMRKMIYKRAATAVARGEVKSADLIRLLSIVSDRTDGKVADKIEHTGNVTISNILDSVSGKTTGLPDPKWFDQPLDVDYTVIAGDTTLKGNVSDGSVTLESEEDKHA